MILDQGVYILGKRPQTQLPGQRPVANIKSKRLCLLFML